MQHKTTPHAELLTYEPSGGQTLNSTDEATDLHVSPVMRTFQARDVVGQVRPCYMTSIPSNHATSMSTTNLNVYFPAL